MNALQKRLIKGYLTPEIECDLPGRLRLGFRKYNLLPPEALPYLHYVKDALDMPGAPYLPLSRKERLFYRELL